MKVIERNILPYQADDFLSPIRDKTDYARLLVCVARQLLLNDETEGYGSVAKLKIVVDKMSRVFLYQERKYFSVAFPFTVLTDTNNNVINITTTSGNKIDYMSISAIISILDNEYFKLIPSLVSLSFEPNSIEYSGVYVLEEILQIEPAYIRYDHDPANVNGKLHPLNHFDINYSQSGTYKLGLKEAISTSYFENLQNINTECSFVVD